MAEKVVPLDLGFSTADAGRPKMEFDDDGLRVEFEDWQEKRIRIKFANTLAFSWVVGELLQEEVSEIQDSLWMTTVVKNWSEADLKNKRHFRITFNASGTLNVISETPSLMI